jgi:hypothetical protein
MTGVARTHSRYSAMLALVDRTYGPDQRALDSARDRLRPVPADASGNLVRLR